MAKEILEKITKIHSPLNISDISADEKKELMFLLAEKGFTSSTFYLRFFQKGFDEWEILGVDECKKRFLELPDVARALLEYVDTDNDDNTSAPEPTPVTTHTSAPALDGDKGYFYVLALSDTPGVFYECLRKVRLCVRFQTFMEELGMSATTATKRFRKDKWKPWETAGLRQTLLEIRNS